MTENKKIELFDKWYDENYDEWAEGEEGIALREELEQAFKGGVEVLEAENAELHKSITDFQNREATLESQIAELKEKVNILDNCDRLGDMITEAYKDQLTKAKEILERLLITSCNSDVLNLLPNCSEVLRVRVEAEQFLKE